MPVNVTVRVCDTNLPRTTSLLGRFLNRLLQEKPVLTTPSSTEGFSAIFAQALPTSQSNWRNGARWIPMLRHATVRPKVLPHDLESSHRARPTSSVTSCAQKFTRSSYRGRQKDASARRRELEQDVMDVLTVFLAKDVYPHLTGNVHAQTCPSVAYNIDSEKTIKLHTRGHSPFRKPIACAFPAEEMGQIYAPQDRASNELTLSSSVLDALSALPSLEPEAFSGRRLFRRFRDYLANEGALLRKPLDEDREVQQKLADPLAIFGEKEAEPQQFVESFVAGKWE
ncbi:hypothetical protein C8R45DRAFT_1074133 [Mycena sanguinolenta]|nr:hypothetical protein C8R45DRAFT_1074133 [Mycena sanguinolenta]